MTTPVRIERGYYLIDTHAWVSQRVAARDEDLTDQLRDFARHDVFRHRHTPIEATDRALLWCAARGWTVADAAPIYHNHDQLTDAVSIILTTGQPGNQALAIVLIDGDEPVVYPDRTTDDGYWHQVATVDICCPNGHQWTWDGARNLTHDWHESTLADVFGLDRYAPFARCHDCAAYDRDETDELCSCGGTAIYCPVCAARCDLALPQIPTFDHPRPDGDTQP